jgi:hypothetical protein
LGPTPERIKSDEGNIDGVVASMRAADAAPCIGRRSASRFAGRTRKPDVVWSRTKLNVALSETIAFADEWQSSGPNGLDKAKQKFVRMVRGFCLELEKWKTLSTAD